MTSLFGLLNINKPAGWTSRDVVNRVQRLTRPHKAGHAGTLDPLATGVLVVCVGQATRLIEYVQAGRKQYRATFLLGRESDTEDIEGEVRLLADPPQPTRDAIAQTLPRFLGPQMQRPPAYSAVKVQGKRSYDLARQGKAVELAARPIEVFNLRLIGYCYPELVLDITCSGGTYVRSLGRDIAQALGTAAVMSGLVRTAVGPFSLHDTCQLDQLFPETLGDWLLPAAEAVAHLPHVTLDEEQIVRIVQGKRLELSETPTTAELAAFDHRGQLVALLEHVTGATWKPGKVFTAAR